MMGSNLCKRTFRTQMLVHIHIFVMMSILIYFMRTSRSVNQTCVTQKTKSTVQVLNENHLTNIVPRVTEIPEAMYSSTTEDMSNYEPYANYSLHPDFIYTMENPTLCSSTPDLKVLVVVHSAPLHVDNRNSIRATWTNISYFPDLGPIKVLFLLGQVKNSSQQVDLQREFNDYGDIVQGDFIDDYHNLTYKAIMGYKWLTERCRNAKVILKTDDDVVINTFKFMKHYLPQYLKIPRLVTCRRGINSSIVRSEDYKWYMPPEILKGQTIYPDFCFGLMVAISNDIVPEMYQASLTTEFLWTDDVYMYGFVARKVKSIQYSPLTLRTEVNIGIREPLQCYKGKKKNDCPYLAIMVEVNAPQGIRELWRWIVKAQRKKQVKKTRLQ